MNTTRGEFPESDLRKEVKKEDVPCGICITTSYYFADGDLASQSIRIEVDPAKVEGLEAFTRPRVKQ